MEGWMSVGPAPTQSNVISIIIILSRYSFTSFASSSTMLKLVSACQVLIFLGRQLDKSVDILFNAHCTDHSYSRTLRRSRGLGGLKSHHKASKS